MTTTFLAAYGVSVYVLERVPGESSLRYLADLDAYCIGIGENDRSEWGTVKRFLPLIRDMAARRAYHDVLKELGVDDE